MTIGQRLTGFRKENGFRNRRFFADCMQVPESLIRSYERDEEKPSPEFLQAVCEKFHVSMNSLLGIQENYYLLTRPEYRLIEKYREADPTAQSLVRSLLDYALSRPDIMKAETTNPK